MIPKSCKECKYKCKGITRGSKKCRIKLGLEERPFNERVDYSTVILWYYYNTSKGMYEKD